jgi:maltose alpha-D-glucosyltransferase/alpha-amylase
MQWTSGKNLGFSTAASDKLYLPVDTAKDAPNVQDQEKNPNSLLNRTRKLIQLKHTEPALAAYAEFVPVYGKENTYPFVYIRAKDNDVVMVILNPSAQAAKAEFTLDKHFVDTTRLAGKSLQIKALSGNKWEVEVPGVSYAIYKLK